VNTGLTSCAMFRSAVMICFLSQILFAGDQQSYQQFINGSERRSDVWTDSRKPLSVELHAKSSRTHEGTSDIWGKIDWVSQAHYRKEFVFGKYHKTVLVRGDKMWSAPRTAERLPEPIEFAETLFESLIAKPPLGGTPFLTAVRKRKQHGRSMMCAAPAGTLYCIDADMQVPLLRTYGGRKLQYGNHREFRGKMLPTTFRIYVNDDLMMEGKLAWKEVGDDSMTWDPPANAEARDFRPCTSSAESVQRVRISSGVSAMHLIENVPPRYPASAKADRVTGKVILQAIIGPDGRINNLAGVSAPRRDLLDAAIDAVRQWKYMPYFLCGEPVEVQTQIEIAFSLSY
jgi:TonB family protein